MSLVLPALLVGIGLACGVVGLLDAVRRSRPRTERPEAADGRAVAQVIRDEAREVNAVQLDAIRELVDERLALAAVPGRGGTTPDATVEQVIAEIVHSLGTPLAAIVATVERTAGSAAQDGPAMRQIGDSADLCRSFLESYRYLGRTTRSGNGHHGPGLVDQVCRAIDVYAAARTTPVVPEVDLPQRLGGLSNDRVRAILAPLIENAVENTSDGRVVVTAREGRPDRVVVSVVNRYAGSLPEGFERDQVSSKRVSGHGRGIVVAKRLAEGLNGEVLFPREADGVFEARVVLPQRRESR